MFYSRKQQIMDNDLSLVESSIHRSARQTAANKIRKVQETHQQLENRLDQSWFIKYQRLIIACSILTYLIVVITVGVLIVYFALNKPTDRTCHIAFIPSAQRPTPYDSRPHHIVTGDFNEDSHSDLVVANSGSDTIGIFINHGNGTFLDQRTVSTGLGSRPFSVAVGHFDDDTKLDLVVAQYGLNSIGVYRGDGMGHFTSHITIPLNASRPVSLVAADFNNDSILDVAVANDGTFTVVILTGHNDGSFGLHSSHPMGHDSNPVCMAVDDLNGDGRTDLVVVNYGTSVLVVLLNDGNGGFVMDRYSTGSGSYPLSVAIGDLNNDEKLDIVVANSVTNNIGVFLGLRDGGFDSHRTHWASYTSRLKSIAINDMNNDTFLDIIVLDSGFSNVIILEGNGTGIFSVITTHSTGLNSEPLSIIVGDFDKDKKPDVAIANNSTNNIVLLRSFLIYPNPIYRSYSPGHYCVSHSVSVADFNEDGYLDLVIPNSHNENVYVFSNFRNQTFHKTKTYSMPTFSYPYFVTTGDVNNDRHIDIIVVLKNLDEVRILLGYGNGTFRKGKNYKTGKDSEPLMAVLTNLNNDGHLDMIVANAGTGIIGIFLGLGNGTFATMTSVLAKMSYHPKCLDVGDFNNDGIVDIAVANSTGSTIAVLLGYGNGSFENPLLISFENTVLNCIAVGDVNQDTQMDIIYTDSLFSQMGILLGYGNGTFKLQANYLTSQSYDTQQIALGYYNNDLRLDIAITNSFDRSVSIFLGTGNGLFDTPIRLITDDQFRPKYTLFVDFDKDNQQEIVIASYGNYSITVVSVNYIADFLNESTYSTGSGPHPSSVAVQDLNNDGQFDLVVANSGNDNIQILSHYKQGVFMNQTLVSLDQDSHPQSIVIADFNKDQLLDIAILNSWENNINVFVRHENGSFDDKLVYYTGSNSFPSSIAGADLNKDGRMDLLIANQIADNVTIFLAFDYVQFNHKIIKIPDLYPGPAYIITADFNNDHRLDIAVSVTNRDKLVIYLGYGNGTFAQQISLSTDHINWPVGLDVGHFNNDDYLDIVAAYSGFSGIGVFLGYGNGSFHSHIFYSTSPDENSAPRSLAVGDFDHDGRLDIVVANNFDHNVWIFFGHGNGSFTGQIVYTVLDQSFPQWVSIADLNNDTHLDLIIANSDPSSVSILSGRGNGRFEHIATLSTGEDSNPYSLAVGDLNKDDRLDIVVVNRNAKNMIIFFRDTNGNYLSQHTYPTGSSSSLTFVLLWDVNNDTILDVLIVDYNLSNSSMAIFYGYGGGNFTPPKIYFTGVTSNPQCIAAGDFNNDGQTDFVMTYQNHGNIGIMSQLKGEPFASATTLSTGERSRPQSLTTADFDHDNHLDLAVANSGTHEVGIFLGYGNGSFHDPFTFSTGPNSSPTALAAGDFNKDRHIDLVIVNSNSDNIMILFGDGYGSFVNRTTYSTGIQSAPCSVAVAYLDRDLYLDVVVTNRGTNNVLVFLGNGDGSLSKLRSYPMGYNARPQSVAIADMNNDDMLDIIIANYGSDFIEILLQIC